MKKKVTSAIVMIDNEGNILACHGTGKPKDSGYDFPKGEVEEGETHKAAAVRELREETDIYLNDPGRKSTWSEVDKLIDCGIYPHNKEKDIHIFLYKTNYFPDLKSLKCTTFFETNSGKKYPEVDGYKIISKSERGMFNKVLQNKFDIIDSFNK